MHLKVPHIVTLFIRMQNLVPSVAARTGWQLVLNFPMPVRDSTCSKLQTPSFPPLMKAFQFIDMDDKIYLFMLL